MKKSFITVLVVALALSAQLATAAFAQKTNEKPIILDGKTYERADLIRDFVDIAFSNTLWNENMGENYKPFFKSFIKKLSKGNDLDTDLAHGLQKKDAFDPWLKDFILRPNGLPKAGVIYRWSQKDVAVGIDWPIYTLSPLRGNMSLKGDKKIVHSSYSVVAPEVDNLLADVVKESLTVLSPQIEEAAGLKVHLQKPEDPIEKTEKYARIRIVPIPATGLDNYFKVAHPDTLNYAFNYWSFSYNRHEFWGAVPFTPYLRAQVQGYLLPDTDNTLNVSVCEIVYTVGKEMMQALVSECLVRALGLPDASKENDAALVGHWNKEYDAYSKLPALDGVSVIRPIKLGMPTLKNEDFPKVKKDLKPYFSLSQYDGAILKLLYCPAIKPGMDKYEVVTVLARHDECLPP